MTNPLKITTKMGGAVARVSLNSDAYIPDAGGDPSASFGCTDGIVAAMSKRNERGQIMYQTNATYRAHVERMIARTGSVSVENVNTDNGRYQTATLEGYQQRAQENTANIGQSEYDKAMIAKFDARDTGKSERE